MAKQPEMQSNNNLSNPPTGGAVVSKSAPTGSPGESDQQLREGEGRFRDQPGQRADAGAERGPSGSRGGGPDDAINNGEVDFSRAMGSQHASGQSQQANPEVQDLTPDESGFGGQGRFRGQQESGGWRGQGQGYQGGPGSRNTEGDYDSAGSGQPLANEQSGPRSDTDLLEAVTERLLWDGDVDASNIQVSVNRGEVTLEGMVENLTQQRLAEETLGALGGITRIHNKLRIPKNRGENNTPSGTNASGPVGEDGKVGRDDGSIDS